MTPMPAPSTWINKKDVDMNTDVNTGTDKDMQTKTTVGCKRVHLVVVEDSPDGQTTMANLQPIDVQPTDHEERLFATQYVPRRGGN